MFENTTPSQPQNPLNPVIPTPGLTLGQDPTANPQPYSPPPKPIHTMPERFRTASPTPGPKGSGTTKKLLITLFVVLGVAGLGVAGLFVFNKFVKTNTNTVVENTANANVINLNTSTNTANLNTVTNTIDENANANTAANVNTNTVANTNVVTNTTTNTNTSPVIGPLPSSTDTDTDGLTDTEEAVLGTDPAKADTDGDTFIDGRKILADGSETGEVVLLYNPKGAGLLEGSGLVKRVENAGLTYSLLVPTSWTTNESAGLLIITPTAQTGEFFQVRSYDNLAQQTLQQWYQANNPQADVTKLKSVAYNGLEGLVSEDGSTVYFKDKGTKIYGLTYTTGSLSTVNYWTTFAMMMKSFKLVTAS